MVLDDKGRAYQYGGNPTLGSDSGICMRHDPSLTWRSRGAMRKALLRRRARRGAGSGEEWRDVSEGARALVSLRGRSGGVDTSSRLREGNGCSRMSRGVSLETLHQRSA